MGRKWVDCNPHSRSDSLFMDGADAGNLEKAGTKDPSRWPFPVRGARLYSCEPTRA